MYKMVERTNHFLADVWCQEACLINKKTLSRSSCTAEDNCWLFLPPLYHPQHTHTHTHRPNYPHISLLSSISVTLFFNPVTSLLHPFCIHALLWLTERMNRTTIKLRRHVMSVSWLLSISTQCCHSDTLSTLPVKPALTAAVLRTRRRSLKLQFQATS